MLARVDKGLALAGWLIAAGLGLMLFVGPQVVAEDEAKPGQAQTAAGSSPYAKPDGGSAVDGASVFEERCGSCHTFEAAGTTGVVGPNLDEADVDAAEVEEIVREGRGGMPAVGSDLSDEEISAVAEYVAGGG